MPGDEGRSEEVFACADRFEIPAGGAKSRPGVAITRIDREVPWTPDPESKQHRERSFAGMNRMPLRAPAEEPAPLARAKDGGPAFTEDVEKTGAKDIGSSARISAGSTTGRIGGLPGRRTDRTSQEQVDGRTGKQAEEQPASEKDQVQGPKFKGLNEVPRITTSPAPAGSFAFPAGFKLQRTQEGR